MINRMCTYATEYYGLARPLVVPITATRQWRFGGKELDRTAGLDLYDFEARAYDPATARFTRPDDLAEKYRPLTPFGFCANNPLIYTDPTGMKFTESAQHWVNQLTDFARQQIDNKRAKISQYEGMLSIGLITEALALSIKPIMAQFENQISELNDMLQEFSVLDASDQIYNVTISDINGTNIGETKYNHSTGFIDMILPPDSGLGLAAHEFKHAYQFEVGTLGFTFHTTEFSLYDITDEKDAYHRQSLITGDNYADILRENEFYKQLQRESVTVRSWINNINNEILSSPLHLQRLANQHKVTFRWNGRTYVGTTP